MARRFFRATLLGFGLLAGTGGAHAQPAAAAPAASRPADRTAGYRNHAALTAELRQIAAASKGAAKLQSLVQTGGGRDVWLLQIAAPGETPPERRPGILIVGGLDADDPAGSETAANVARKLVQALTNEPDGETAKLLKQRVVYVAPRVNADGMENFFAPVVQADRRNARKVDEDRDGAFDEDGPDDLNGDGVISVMRVRDPNGPWMTDPDEPRLLKKADRAKNERGVYKLLLEGSDNDQDGEINEDGPGGVDDDRNWPHFFEPGVAAAGTHPLSEPETRALAEFVVSHPKICAAVVYGRHDNLVSVPKGEQRGPDGQSYRDLVPEDVKYYEYMSEKYKEISGVKTSAGARPEGAFYSWIYAQRGVPAFAVSVWGGPEEPKPATQPASRPASSSATQPTTRPASQPKEAGAGDPESEDEGEPAAAPARGERPSREEMAERFRARFGDRQPTREEIRTFTQEARGGGEGGGRQAVPQAGPGDEARAARRGAGGGRRGGGGGGGGGPPGGGGRGAPPGEAPRSSTPPGEGLDARVESNDTLKRWLKYSDQQRGGAGFTAWTEFNHPTLGKVELGGLAPYFNTTPPAAELDGIADKQVKFLNALSSGLPAPRFGKPKVKNLGGGVWQVEVRLVNDGYWPTHCASARQNNLPAFAVRPSFDKRRFVGGRLLERIETLPGGGAATLRWLLRGNEGEAIEFSAYQRTYGELKIRVVLRETPPGEENE